jgi:hypothetical protein
MTANNRQPGFPMPVRRTELDPDLVVAAVKHLTGSLRYDDMEVEVDHADADPTITVCENERRMSTRLSKLCDRFGRAGVEPTEQAVSAAVSEWVDNRPVSDDVAAAKGIATIDWLHHAQGVRWRVVVPRRSGVSVEWVPTLRTPLSAVRDTRAAAADRARHLTVTPLPTGDVTVWVYLLNPRLSTAVLTQPELLADGQPIEQLYAVFSPGRPVAVATKVPAMRLTEESNEPHVALPLENLNDIGWM